MTCDVFLGMMQTTANEGEAGEEETKGTGGLCVRVSVSLEYQEWMFELGRQIPSSPSPPGPCFLCHFI